MTAWTFSDDTTVELGGKVEGASFFAQELRRRIASGPLLMSLEPLPAERIEVDLNDVALLNHWLMGQMKMPRFRELKLRLVDAPKDIPPLPATESEREDEPGTVY